MPAQVGPLVSGGLCLCRCHAVPVDVEYNLKSGTVMPQVLLLLFETGRRKVFRAFCVLMNFKCFSICLKNDISILMAVVLSL